MIPMGHSPQALMRLPGRPEKRKKDPAPEDTQEMFAAGGSLPADPEETREYEAVTVEQEPEGTEAEELLEDEEKAEAIEEEGWDDEYEEWDEDLEAEELEEGLEDEEDPDSESGDTNGEADPAGSRSGDLKVFLAQFRERVRTIWSRSLGRIGAIKLPNHKIDGQKVLAVAGIVAIAGLVGAGGYVIGKGSGDDLDTARLEGEFAGKRAGAIEGATSGYAAGFKKGRDIAFRKSYSASYRRNYIRAYEDVGMEAPKPKDIEVPEP